MADLVLGVLPTTDPAVLGPILARAARMIKQLLKFGAFSILTVGLTLWIGLQIAQYQSDDRYKLRPAFDDVTGLFPGDDVKLTGRAGRQGVGHQRRTPRTSTRTAANAPVRRW